MGRASAVLVANRINNIDSSSDVYPTTDFNASTEPDGDQNAAIYITKSIALENPATSIKVIFSAIKRQPLISKFFSKLWVLTSPKI